ncbi:ATP-binding protein [Desulforhopalus singaporensis]|uniref:4Fe-4S binding domain-containing protein n=1 Tax=Desulforhopalus singaporensis TaxID=91360 RepID=A0A1H0TXG6_9BACT|nr:4Fe-4S binding protein [Desulforhopalus singaporensis]SDP58633.1 4Fe-4S binding domain-containing protein [Desulforhopalus singaporensis]
MGDIYKELATHLDNLPGGFPETASGVELRILKRLFSPEEALVATKLTMKPEPVDAFARRTGDNREELGETLESMAGKGLIFRTYKDGIVMYSAAMFVIGIWEYHVHDLDADLVNDVNEYLPHLAREVWDKVETKQLRVVPVSASVAPETAIASYEDAEQLIRAQSKITVQPCICRKEHEVVGKPCQYPLEVCFSFGGAAYYYEQNNIGRSIDVEEALKILETGREAGLIIQPGNAQKSANICMCCSCCCQVLKNIKVLEKPAEEVHSNYFAVVDDDECVACGDCEERCHMDAIIVDDHAEINLDRCIGCGVCVPACPTSAIQLRAKPQENTYVPPKLTYQTYLRMAKERGKLAAKPATRQTE